MDRTVSRSRAWSAIPAPSALAPATGIAHPDGEFQAALATALTHAALQRGPAAFQTGRVIALAPAAATATVTATIRATIRATEG